MGLQQHQKSDHPASAGVLDGIDHPWPRVILITAVRAIRYLFPGKRLFRATIAVGGLFLWLMDRPRPSPACRSTNKPRAT